MIDSNEMGYLKPIKSIELSSVVKVPVPPWSKEFLLSLLEKLK